MTVTINGEPTDVKEAATVREVLVDLNLGESAVAVAVNSTFVPRSEHTTYRLQAGDKIELVAPMQGG